MKHFANDMDKMRDFVLLTKEEFLQFYYYLSEKEYEETAKVVQGSFSGAIPSPTHTLGSFVVIDEDGALDSSDKTLLLSLSGKTLQIVEAKLVDGYELWHYHCAHNGELVLSESGDPFPFIDADLKIFESAQ